MELEIRVQDPSGAPARDVRLELKEGALAEDLAEALVQLFEWPRATIAGDRIAYQLKLPSGGAVVEPKATVVSIGLSNGSLLVVGPALARTR